MELSINEVCADTEADADANTHAGAGADAKAGREARASSRTSTPRGPPTTNSEATSSPPRVTASQVT